MMATTTSLLSYRYNEQWPTVLRVLGEALRVMSTAPIALVADLLTSLADVVDADDSIVTGPERTAARSAIAVAIEMYGLAK